MSTKYKPKTEENILAAAKSVKIYILQNYADPEWAELEYKRVILEQLTMPVTILKLDDKHTTIAKHYLREQAIRKEHPVLLQIYFFAKIRETKRLITNHTRNTFMNNKTSKRNYNYIKRTGTTD